MIVKPATWFEYSVQYFEYTSLTVSQVDVSFFPASAIDLRINL